MHRTRYLFSHRAGGRYYWTGPHLPGDSRAEVVSCNVEWFWNPAPLPEGES